MSFQKINLSDLKSNAKVKPEIMEKVWLLNLDQIESNTGKVLNYEEVPFQGIGSSTIYFQKGTVLYSKLRPYLNKVVIADRNGFATSELVPIVCNEELIYPKYLAYFLRSESFLKFASNVVAGAKMPRMVMSEFWNYEIPLPPLSEQKRIAKILDKADELRQKRQQSIEKLDELLQATFIDMFGDPITNPKGWEICEVGKVTDCIVPARDKPKSFTGDIPWITTDDLNHLGFTETSKKNIGLTNEEITLAKARLIPKNSVVISCVGNLGLASIASDNFVMNQQLHSFQCGDKILPEFLIFCLPFQKGYMLSRATSTTVPYMNKSVCNSIPVTVPPLDLQKKWKLIFENSNKQKQVLKKQLAQQENLFQSLQQRAFNGEL